MQRGSEVSTLFASLLRFCRACGLPAEGDICDACDTSLEVPRFGDVGALGARVRVSKMFRTDEYVVVGGNASEYRVVAADGTKHTVPIGSVSDYRQPLEGRWSPGGALLAASMREGASAAMRSVMTNEAFRWASDLADQRALLVDALRLRKDDIASGLSVSPTELLWTQAVSKTWRDGFDEAAREVLELPEGTYPARIAIWYSAADTDQVDPGFAAAVERQLAGLEGLGPAVAAACSLVRARLAPEGQPDSELTQQVEAARHLGEDAAAWQRAVPDQHWNSSDSPEAKILRAYHGDSDGLGGDPSVLDHAPLPLLDDLIDGGVIPTRFVLDADGLEHGDYLLARVAPERAPEEALVRFGAHVERARRAFLEGRPCPDDVPQDVEQRYQIWCARRDNPAEHLAEAYEAAGDPRADELRDALEDPSGIPPEGLLELEDGTLLKVLASRSELGNIDVDPSSLAANQREFIGHVLIRRAKAELHEWSWESAFESAKQALRFAREEQLRDEALNLLACAQWQMGNDEAALRALETALEGEYTESLQSNISVVAAELAPRKAADHLARLVVEAPDLELRVSAAHRAVEIWGFSDEPWADEDRLPHSLANALRSLVTAPIPLADFGDIVRLLADYDAEWLSSPGRLNGSPHRHSDEAKVWVARAKDFSEFVSALSSVVRRANPPEWAIEHRDRLVGLALQTLIVDDPPFGAVAFGMAVLDQDMPMPADDKAVLRAFVARGAAMSIDPDEGEPAEKFLDWLEEASRELPTMPDEYQDRAREAIEIGFSALAGAYLQSRWRQFQEAAQFHDTIVEQISGVPSYQLNHSEVRKAAQPIRSFCSETKRIMRRLRPHMDDEGTTYVDELLEATQKLDEYASRLG